MEKCYVTHIRNSSKNKDKWPAMCQDFVSILNFIIGVIENKDGINIKLRMNIARSITDRWFLIKTILETNNFSQSVIDPLSSPSIYLISTLLVIVDDLTYDLMGEEVDLQKIKASVVRLIGKDD